MKIKIYKKNYYEHVKLLKKIFFQIFSVSTKIKMWKQIFFNEIKMYNIKKYKFIEKLKLFSNFLFSIKCEKIILYKHDKFELYKKIY